MFGATTPALIAAVLRAGALAFEGAGQRPADQLERRLAEIRALSPDLTAFGVNFFVPSGYVVEAQQWSPAQARAVEHAAMRCTEYFLELGAEVPASEPASLRAEEEALEQRVDVAIAAGVKLVSFHFGWPSERIVGKLREAGAQLWGHATSVAEARFLVSRGADALVLQGAEAGGHRGTFLEEEGLVGVEELLRTVVAAVGVPVVAAGGVMEGGGARALLDAGASSVLLGTAFLACPEASVHPLHRAALLSGADLQTVVTKVYTGKPARGLVTGRAERLGDLETSLPNCFNAMPLGRALNAEAFKASRSDAAYMWAGTGYRKCRALSATELVQALAEEGTRGRL